MANALHLHVRTPAQTLLQVEGVEWIHIPLADGAGISIYPGHAPLLAETATGSLRYADGSGEHTFRARPGVLQIEDNRVTVFTSGESEPGERPRPATVSEEQRFNRLARELQARLHGESRDILEMGREER